MVKGSRSWNKIVESWLFPKNEQTIFFLSRWLENVEAWILISSLKYFQTNYLFNFFGRLDNFVSRSTDLPDWPLVTIFLPTLNLEVFTFLRLCPIFVSSTLLLQLSVTDELSSSLTWLFTVIDWEDFILLSESNQILLKIYLFSFSSKPCKYLLALYQKTEL